MITWRAVLMVLRAICVICSDCCSQSLATSLRTIASLYITMKGVASIDKIIAASTGLASHSGSSERPCASASSTKPNSPACARYRPVRSDTPVVAPSRRASSVTSASLNSSGSTSSSATSPQWSTTTCQSNDMPMVMKNRPSSTSWKARMSVSTWCLYSVSDTSMPAMKAPSASDSPACSVSQARPSVTSSRFSMNSSSLRRRATSVSHQRITRGPPYSSSPTSTVALSMARPRALASASGGAPSAGTSTSSGTTAKSWNSSTPITRRPCSLSSSSRSAISLTTIAVLLIASAPDSASAVCQPSCQRGGSTRDSASAPAVAASMVSVTCSAPSPNTCLRIARSLGRLNSRPITNIRNTTPNSPRCLMPSSLSESLSACGPISTPATR